MTTLPKRPCAKCGKIHMRKHAWCKPCFREWLVLGRKPKSGFGTPPKPPPGFRESDLQTGRPLL